MDGSATTTQGARRRAPGSTRSTAGLLAVLAASAGAVALLGRRARDVVPTGPEAAGALRVDDWVELVVLAAGLAAATWVLLGATAALVGVAAVRRGRAGRTTDNVVGRWAPGVVRRLARGAVGASLGAGMALTPAAALADDRPAPGDGPAAVVSLGWETTSQQPSPPVQATDDERPVAPDPRPPTESTDDDVTDAQRASNQVDEQDEVVVVRGDTLWAIAARDLPPDASDADVLRAVTSWHDANRDVIGDDPDVILPGQVLRAP
ncbi:hypothetical protein GCM10009718_30310 [Isoptericola halotolerans]|uniref:LysM domain-containing protein n=1 Tax=Isoptericola halotolerans TaxID=300560 RepID=A0ABX2A450_9MICO|nr:LysM peptidoglycan-binding domain-containing protein [Isoptericola halotolerans]NOV97630.1 hypothetical protein [Isoptericola halotolerans]